MLQKEKGDIAVQQVPHIVTRTFFPDTLEASASQLMGYRRIGARIWIVSLLHVISIDFGRILPFLQSFPHGGFGIIFTLLRWQFTDTALAI
jgi:hypothetical protein